MGKFFYILYFLIFISSILFAQEQEIDTTKIVDLEEVIVISRSGLNNQKQEKPLSSIDEYLEKSNKITMIKREGFKTYKALRITKNTFTWLAILTVLLMIEKGFDGTGWLSEVIVVPFMVLQIISALKNASMAGLIKTDELNKILDRIDNHKGLRK